MESGTWKNEDCEARKSKPVKCDSVKADSPFTDPVFRQIALKNGEVNRMTKDELKIKLTELRMDTRGVKEVLRKRLKNYYKKFKLRRAKVHTPEDQRQLYDYLLVIDFEATCLEHNPTNFQFEIIEFPIVLLNVHTMAVEEEFHCYVKPVVHPTLSKFCTTLTGITQDLVDNAKMFSEVINEVDHWMTRLKLQTDHSIAVVTDGPWDMGRFMHSQCQISHIAFPEWALNWINLRKAYSNFYSCPRGKLAVMLENLGMTFEGQQHKGIDDARNIARILIRMLQDGAILRVNESLYAHKRAQLNMQDTGCQDDSCHSNVEKLATQLQLVNVTSSDDVEEEDLGDLLEYYKLSGQKPLGNGV